MYATEEAAGSRSALVELCVSTIFQTLLGLGIAAFAAYLIVVGHALNCQQDRECIQTRAALTTPAPAPSAATSGPSAIVGARPSGATGSSPPTDWVDKLNEAARLFGLFMLTMCAVFVVLALVAAYLLYEYVVKELYKKAKKCGGGGFWRKLLCVLLWVLVVLFVIVAILILLWAIYQAIVCIGIAFG